MGYALLFRHGSMQEKFDSLDEALAPPPHGTGKMASRRQRAMEKLAPPPALEGEELRQKRDEMRAKRKAQIERRQDS